jgi:hypothetical protein
LPFLATQRGSLYEGDDSGGVLSCFAISTLAASAMPICTVEYVVETYCADENEYADGSKRCEETARLDRGWALKRENKILAYYDTEADALKVAHHLEAKKACAVLE